MKTIINSLLLLCSFSLHAQFAGSYDPALWSEIHVPSCDNGFVQTETAPGSIIVTGAEAGCNQGDPSITGYEITLTSCGTISFHWDYQTSDCQGPYWDPFGYLLNGIPVQLTLDGSTTSGDNDQSGFVSVPVDVGDVFSFYVFSRDNYCGEAHTAISKFNGPNTSVGLLVYIPDPIYYGYGPLSCTTLMAEAFSGTPPYTYVWSLDENTGDAPNLSTVCATSPECFTVSCEVTDAACNTNYVWVEIEVINAICEGTNKVELCHKNNTICVPYNAVAAHLAHGDQLGVCGETADCDTEMMIADLPKEPKENQVQSPILNRTSDHAILSLLASEIKSDFQSDRMNVFPNPATDKLYLSLTRIPEGSYHVSLVNTNGGMLKSFDVEFCQGKSVEIDISILPAGMYQVWVTLAKGAIISKTIIVQ